MHDNIIHMLSCVPSYYICKGDKEWLRSCDMNLFMTLKMGIVNTVKCTQSNYE